MATYGDIKQAGFKVDTADLLGFKYQAYIAACRGLALSKPDLYFEMRAQVMEGVRAKIIEDLYNTLYAAMSVGRDKSGAEIFPGGKFGHTVFVPNYPQDKINVFCVEAVTNMSDDINRCMDIILPDDFEKLAAGKLNLKGRGETITLGTA